MPACGAKYMKNGLSGSIVFASWMNWIARFERSSARW